MKIRIHDTDFEGNPVECTGEYFCGKNPLEIIEGMKLNPFQASLTPKEYMRRVLDQIGQEKFALPDDEGKAAIAFLQRLAALRYASIEPDAGEADVDHVPLPEEKEDK